MKAEDSSSIASHSSLWGCRDLLFSHVLANDSWFIAPWHKETLLDSLFGSPVASHTAIDFKEQTKVVMSGMLPWAPLL